MSKYMIASATHKDDKNLPRYWDTTSKCWTPQATGTVFDEHTRDQCIKQGEVPLGGQWELFDDGTVQYRASCPKCRHPAFEEVLTDVTVSSEFTSMQLHEEEDFLEPDYIGSENHGGVIDRYQCASCGHVVAKTPTEFREWVKQHGVKQ